jgi:hypothetical protein
MDAGMDKKVPRRLRIASRALKGICIRAPAAFIEEFGKFLSFLRPLLATAI